MGKKRVNAIMGFLSIILLVSFVAEIRADDTVDYVMKSNASYIWYECATTITTLDSGNWDDGYFDIELAGWDLWFYGRRIINVRMSTNGYAIPGESAQGPAWVWWEQPMATKADPNTVCAVNWNDWWLDTNGDFAPDPGRAMKYQMFGTAPHRILVLEWVGVAPLGWWDYYTFEMLLYEGSSDIRFQYKDIDEGHASFDYGANSCIGIENRYGSKGVEYSYHAASLANEQAILFTPYSRAYGNSHSDFDNDNISDIGVFKDSGLWRVRYSGGGSLSQTWGAKGDIPLSGDFDGDTIADLAVFKPASGLWRILYSATHYSGSTLWGVSGDTPVPGDYDGDTIDDVAVFKPYAEGVGTWRIQYSSGGSTAILFGARTDIPIPGDYDGDGITDIAIYKRASGLWRINYSSGGALSLYWGTKETIPVPGDYDGDGITDIATFNPFSGLWRIKYSGGGQGSIYWGQRWDSPTTLLLAGDSLGDITISRDSGDSKLWLIRRSTGGSSSIYWGAKHDSPIGK